MSPFNLECLNSLLICKTDKYRNKLFKFKFIYKKSTFNSKK